MRKSKRLEQIRRIARRPYSFIALCSFAMFALCAIQALAIWLFMTAPAGVERLLLNGSVILSVIALTQGLASLREKQMGRLILELVRMIEGDEDPASHPAPPAPAKRK